MGDPMDNGGSAFPLSEVRGPLKDIVSEPQHGMTLRDYFAGQALASTDSATKERLFSAARKEGADLADYIAQSCYEIADAMLAVREKDSN